MFPIFRTRKVQSGVPLDPRLYGYLFGVEASDEPRRHLDPEADQDVSGIQLIPLRTGPATNVTLRSRHVLHRLQSCLKLPAETDRSDILKLSTKHHTHPHSTVKFRGLTLKLCKKKTGDVLQG